MEKLDKEFMDYISMMGKGFGMGDSMLRIFAALYIEPEDVPLERIAEKTGYSLASVSNTVRMLENMGAIRRSRKPGSKKVYVFLEKDMFRFNIMKIDMAKSFIINPAKKKLPSIIKTYKKQAKNDEEKKKLAIIKNYYEQILAFEDLLVKWKRDLQEIGGMK